jgi:hypothetical protein
VLTPSLAAATPTPGRGPATGKSPLPFSRSGAPPSSPGVFKAASDPLSALNAQDLATYESQLRAQAALIEATRAKVAALERRVQEVKAGKGAER